MVEYGVKEESVGVFECFVVECDCYFEVVSYVGVVFLL